jgi:tetratricopeptide (TPR) repeat protein
MIQFVPWFIEEFIEPRRRARPKERPPQQLPDAGRASSSASVRHRKEGGGQLGYKEKAAVAVLRMLYRLAGPLRFLKQLSTRKDFAYWVGLALGENDPSTRVKYCSRALELNPGYEPAWGLKAITLLGLQRYEEAMGCFDRVLEIRPHATAWHQKGLCCYHLKRHAEAVACFDKALAARADTNHQLFDEAARHRELAEEALRQQGAAERG